MQTWSQLGPVVLGAAIHMGFMNYCGWLGWYWIVRLDTCVSPSYEALCNATHSKRKIYTRSSLTSALSRDGQALAAPAVGSSFCPSHQSMPMRSHHPPHAPRARLLPFPSLPGLIVPPRHRPSNCPWTRRCCPCLRDSTLRVTDAGCIQPPQSLLFALTSCFISSIRHSHLCPFDNHVHLLLIYFIIGTDVSSCFYIELILHRSQFASPSCSHGWLVAPTHLASYHKLCFLVFVMMIGITISLRCYDWLAPLLSWKFIHGFEAY